MERDMILQGALPDAVELGEQASGALPALAVIGKDEIHEAEGILQRYKQGKANLERRIVENEQWYKMRHWEQIRTSKNPGDPLPTSAWLLNCIANKHADAMDNYPSPSVLPREAGDEMDADMLSQILPVVLEQNEYEQTYNDMWWYKLKTGTGVTGVFWNKHKQNGLGDIDIRYVDMLNLFWEPGVMDIQRSQNLFNVELADKKLLQQQYPQLKNELSTDTVDIATYIYDDSVDTSGKAAVVDWYYKRNVDGRTVVHYCKFTNGQVLYASENDENYAQRGFYDHGKYPFVFDTLFPEAGTPAGFGYIDVCKDPQLYIDKLDQVILKHAVMGARPRFFVRGDGNINEAEFADWTKDFVHYQGSGNPAENITPIEIAPLSEAYVTVRSLKIDELKETSGNRDFSQGSTTSGVTAASAIAALQEAGSKLSRDMIKSSYRAFAQVCYLVLELMRQFYTEDRYFRVMDDKGVMQFVAFNAQRIAAKPQGTDFGRDMGVRVPVFDVRVVSQKSSPFSTVAQNERAKELYGMGFFRPDLADQALAALDMMQFEGIEKVRERISQNGTLYEQIQLLQGQMMEMASIIDAQNGTQIAQPMAQSFGQQVQVQSGGSAKPGTETEMQAMDETMGKARSSQAGQARAKTARAATPRA